jgi:hypothetical protein
MKRLIYILILIISLPAFGTDYYFSSENGSNDSTGLTPIRAWETLDSLYVLIDDSRLSAGDVVHFERGSAWYEVDIMKFTTSGTSGNYIQFTTFGTGNMPILSGGKTLGSHTATDGNKYIYVDSDIPGPDYDAVTSRGRRFLGSVVIDSIRKATSIHPNDTFLFASDIDNYSLEDAGQNWTVNQWTNGWISVRFDNWHWTAARVLSNTSYTMTTSGFDTIVFSDPNNSEEYYQILNAYDACDLQDEWYSNTDSLVICSPAGAPGTVLVSIKDTAMNFEDVDYYQFDSIHFKDFNMFVAHIKRGNSIEFNHCYMEGIGYCGVFYWGAVTDTPGSGDSDDGLVTNNRFEDCLLNSVLFKYCHGGTITNNYFNRNGIHNGYQNIPTQDYPHGAHNYAISFTNNLGDPGEGLIRYNIFDSIGAGAIMLHYEQDPVTFPNNLIRDYGMSELGDLAAIYAVSDPTSGTQVKTNNNIIMNAHNLQYTIDSLEDYGAANNKFVDRFTHAVYFDQDTYNYKGDSNSIEDCNVGWFTNGGKNRSFRYNNILRPNKVGMHPYHANTIHNSYSIPLVSGTSETDTVRYNKYVFNDSTTNGYTFHRQSGGYDCTFPCDGMVDDNDYFDPGSGLQYVGAAFTSGSLTYSDDNVDDWADRTIICTCGTYDPGNNATQNDTAYTRIYLLKNFDDDTWVKAMEGGDWRYADGSVVGPTVSVPPFYSTLVFTQDVSPTTLIDINIDTSLVPLFSFDFEAGEPEPPAAPERADTIRTDTSWVNFGNVSVSGWTTVGSAFSGYIGNDWAMTTSTVTGESIYGVSTCVYESGVCSTYVYNNAATGEITVTITGLDDNRFYDFDIFLSRSSVTERQNIVNATGGFADTIDVNNNTDLIEFRGVAPSGGQIVVTSDVYSGAAFCYFNAMVIMEYYLVANPVLRLPFVVRGRAGALRLKPY